jgi:hypothetical protein
VARTIDTPFAGELPGTLSKAVAGMLAASAKKLKEIVDEETDP